MSTSTIIIAPLYAQSYPKSSGYSNSPMFVVRAYPVDENGWRGAQLANRVFTGGTRLRTVSSEVRFVDSGNLYAIGGAVAVARAIREALGAAGYESVEFQSTPLAQELELTRELALVAGSESSSASPPTNHEEESSMKKTNARISSQFGSHKFDRCERRPRKLPVCPETGLPCFDERHQAGDAVKAVRHGNSELNATAFRCEDCSRWHVAVTDLFMSAAAATAAQLSTASDTPRTGRIIILDIENATLGGRGGADGVAKYLAVLCGQALVITHDDIVIVAAARQVVRKFEGTFTGHNIIWLAGEDVADGADRAALDWLRLNLRALAPDFAELVLISGDHAFARAARRGQKYGLRVRVVTTEHSSGRSTLSRELAAAAHVHTTVRLKSRSLVRQNSQAIDLVARPKHRRVHVANPSLVAA